MTLHELKTLLATLDEVTLLEILNLHSDEIVERFSDLIEKQYVELNQKVEEPSAIPERDEERYTPLTGELHWTQASYKKALLEHDENE